MENNPGSCHRTVKRDCFASVSATKVRNCCLVKRGSLWDSPALTTWSEGHLREVMFSRPRYTASTGHYLAAGERHALSPRQKPTTAMLRNPSLGRLFFHCSSLCLDVRPGVTKIRMFPFALVFMRCFERAGAIVILKERKEKR